MWGFRAAAAARAYNTNISRVQLFFVEHEKDGCDPASLDCAAQWGQTAVPQVASGQPVPLYSLDEATITPFGPVCSQDSLPCLMSVDPTLCVWYCKSLSLYGLMRGVCGCVSSQIYNCDGELVL